MQKKAQEAMEIQEQNKAVSKTALPLTFHLVSEKRTHSNQRKASKTAKAGH
jgi:hypothetical protein